MTRSALFWAAIRAVLLPFGVGFGRLAPAVLVVVLVTIFTGVAMRRRREHIFLGNLGVTVATAAAVNGATAAGLEFGAASAARLL